MADWYSFVKRPKDGTFLLLSPDRSDEHLTVSHYAGRASPAIFLYAQDAAYELFSGSLWKMEALGQNFYRELTEDDARELLSRDNCEALLEEVLHEEGLPRITEYRSLLTPESCSYMCQVILRAHAKEKDDLKREEERRKQQEEEDAVTRDRKRVSLKVDDVPAERLGDYVGTLAEQQQARVRNKSRKGRIRRIYDKVRAYLRD